MELRDFLATTLREIIAAIADAAEYAGQHGAEVNPHTLEWREDQGHVLIYDDETGLLATLVEFDVAITATESRERGVDGGIKVLGLHLGLGAHADSSAEMERVSRIKFNVPVVLPSSKRKMPKRKALASDSRGPETKAPAE